MRDTLQNDLVTVRRLQTADAPAICEAIRDSLEHLQTWMPWCHAEYSLADTEIFIAKETYLWDAGEEYSFAILNRDQRFVGVCGLNQFNRIHHLANLGYWLRRDATGHGYASAAARLVAQFGLVDLSLTRVEILAAVGNEPSQRVAQRAGAVREGILRSRLWLHDRAHDAVCYSIVRSSSPVEA